MVCSISCSVQKRRVGAAAPLRIAAVLATIEDDYDEALRFGLRSLQLYRDSGDLPGVAEALHANAVIEQRRGNLDKARSGLLEAIPMFEAAGHHRGLVASLGNLAMMAIEEGDFQKADRLLKKAHRACEQVKDEDLEASITAVRASVSLARSNLEEAKTLASAALEAKRANNNQIGVALVQTTLAAAFARDGKVDEAIPYLIESLETGIELDAHPILIYAFEGMAEITILQNESNSCQAAKYLMLAAALREKYQFRQRSCWNVLTLSERFQNELGESLEKLRSDVIADEWRTAAEQFVAGVTETP